MPITNTSPENILKYLHAAGTGTKEAMKNSTSPRGILEWLVNFFYLWWSKEKQRKMLSGGSGKADFSVITCK